MSKGPEESRAGSSGKLAEAMRQIRLAAADRADVVVEMREADRARLELLAHELADVIDEVPPDDDRFDFALSSGLQPRFWIDATAHVMMGPDRRTYRFVRDTRLGRILLAESADREKIADRVTVYIAERLNERELVIAGETVSMRELVTGRSLTLENTSLLQGPAPHEEEQEEPETAAGLPPRRRPLSDGRGRYDRHGPAGLAPGAGGAWHADTGAPQSAGHAGAEAPDGSVAGRPSTYGTALFWVVALIAASFAWRYRDALLAAASSS